MNNKFIKYQHLEKFGTSATANIQNGECYIFPKIDGTNSQIYYDDKTIIAASRNRVLSLDNDNANFYQHVIDNKLKYELFFNENPNLRLYGEWLVPHTLKTYNENAWNKFYVFDVLDYENYLHYNEYSKLLDKYDIEYIVPIAKIKNPDFEILIKLLDKNTYLIKDGMGIGEGLVVKNYDYKNKFGRIVWAKIINNDFKSKHNKNNTTELKTKDYIEEKIAAKYCNLHLCKKEYAKIELGNEWCSKLIPRLLDTIYYNVITEEIWNIIKEYKNPIIDFKKLQYFVNIEIKKHLKELF